MLFEVSDLGRGTFELRGELDMATAPLLLEAVAAVVDEPGDILLDLSGLSFMDSSGLHAMIQIADPLVDGLLLLTAPQPNVQRVLEMTGLDGHGNIRVMGDHGAAAVQRQRS